MTTTTTLHRPYVEKELILYPDRNFQPTTHLQKNGNLNHVNDFQRSSNFLQSFVRKP
jgi:hypothetical protein